MQLIFETPNAIIKIFLNNCCPVGRDGAGWAAPYRRLSWDSWCSTSSSRTMGCGRRSCRWGTFKSHRSGKNRKNHVILWSSVQSSRCCLIRSRPDCPPLAPGCLCSSQSSRASALIWFMNSASSPKAQGRLMALNRPFGIFLRLNDVCFVYESCLTSVFLC